MQDRRYFLICSQGEAGSIWLADSLSLHPDITCSMGIDHPVVSMESGKSPRSLDYIWERWSEKITSADCIQYGIADNDGSFRDVLRGMLNAKGVEAAIPNRKMPMSFDQTFSELERFYGTSVYGNVHGYIIRNAVPMMLESSGQRQPIVFNLIRHPVSRFQSLVGRKMATQAYEKGSSDTLEVFLGVYGSLLIRRGLRDTVDWTERNNRYMASIFFDREPMQDWSSEILDFPHVVHLPMERLMGDPDYFLAVANLMTSGLVGRDMAFRDAVFAADRRTLGRAHPLERGMPSKTPEDAFNSWPEWLRTLAAVTVAEHGLAGIHAPYGYDFSFMS